MEQPSDAFRREVSKKPQSGRPAGLALMAHQIPSIPIRYQRREIWTFKDKSPCLLKYQTPHPAQE